MGDILLAFPLLRLLRRQYPDHPLWVLAEGRFFKHLLPLVPDVTFFPTEMAERLRSMRYCCVINLSHRQDSALLCGSLKSDAVFGITLNNGERHINGFWALYRASLTQNNRYNRFHWSDMPCLDCVADAELPPLELPNPVSGNKTGMVGLFVGASSTDKHPDAEFWGRLARRLLAYGLRPFFFGGEAEKETGREAARIASLPASNLCGRFSLPQLMNAFKSLEMLITPDTGPMHLAAQLGVPVLNLSLGPVNARETAPLFPGHIVMRSALSCVGCWQCSHSFPLCKTRFSPLATARAAAFFMHREKLLPAAGSLRSFRTVRGKDGLYDLLPLYPLPQTLRELLEVFWKAFFSSCRNPSLLPSVEKAMQEICDFLPNNAGIFRTALLRMYAETARSAVRSECLPASFWQNHIPALRPFSGYMHMYLQNENYSSAAWKYVLGQIERLLSCFPA